jgi:hypothetical protein
MKDIPLIMLSEDGELYEYEGHRIDVEDYALRCRYPSDESCYAIYPANMIFENRPDAVKQQIKQYEAFIKQTETKLNEVKERLEKLRSEL